MDVTRQCMRGLRVLAAAVALMPPLAIGASPVDASAEPIGHVKTVVGDAWVGGPGAESIAQVGTPIHVGAILRTGPGATLGATLRDETVISIGPDSEVSVDEFLFDPSAGELKLGANMVRGTLNFISGWIARLKPDAQTVKTPTGMIGVRGTHFLVKISDQ